MKEQNKVCCYSFLYRIPCTGTIVRYSDYQKVDIQFYSRKLKQLKKNGKTCPLKAKILFDFRRFFRFFYSLIFLKNSIKIQVIDKKKYIRVVTALTQEYAKDKVHAKAHQWHMQNNNQEKHNYDFHSENNWLKSPHIFSLRINSTSSGKKQLQNPGKIFGQFWAKFLKNTGSKMKK